MRIVTYEYSYNSKLYRIAEKSYEYAPLITCHADMGVRVRMRCVRLRGRETHVAHDDGRKWGSRDWRGKGNERDYLRRDRGLCLPVY